jgi:hypothetical protein
MPRLAAVVAVLFAAGACAASGAGHDVLARSKKPTTPQAGAVWVQTMDSCKQALPAATLVLTGAGVSQTATAPSGRKKSVIPKSTCPELRGNCSSVPVGCVTFTGLTAGTYRVTTTHTPPPDRSDPEGFAPCQGGSACRSEVATVVVSAAGAVQGTVTDVYPDGMSETFPASGAFAGTQKDPVVLHDFGMAPPGFAPQCDGDSDADDHLTGNMRGHCGYPEADETTACQPYPWSCATPAVATAAKPG